MLNAAVKLPMEKLPGPLNPGGGPLGPNWLNIAVRFPMEKFPLWNPDGGENGFVIFKLKFEPFPNAPCSD